MEATLHLLVKRLSQTARLPSKGSKFAAGYDLYSSEEGLVPAKGKALIKTGISIAVPTGNYGRVAPRSGLAVKNFIDVGAGVIDEDYRGEVGVVLFNHSDIDFKVSIGDRIAQLIVEKITDTSVKEVEQLDETVRGEGGFGSTGVSNAIPSHADLSQSSNRYEGQNGNLKRRSPYGPLLQQEVLFSEANEAMQDDFQWKEWSVLVLYTLCESGLISVDEKKKWANLVFSGEKKAYEFLRSHVQGSDLSGVRDALNRLQV